MFTTLIVQPIFNLLVLIYTLLPGHNFGVAIILFTIVIRMLMWPLVKKQLHQSKVMRKLQPEIKRIKADAKGDRQKESLMLMELYKERGINPFASLGPLLLQLPIFIGLYLGLQRVVKDPQEIYNFSYGFLRDTEWLKSVAENIHRFDETLFGIIDLTRPALSEGGFYLPAFLIVVASVIIQYYQAKQLMPSDKDSRSLRQILRDAGEGKQADQSEVNAAVGRSTRFLLPAMIFTFTIGIASALSLYWLVSGLVAYIQQAMVLNKDEEEMEEIADRPARGSKPGVKVTFSTEKEVKQSKKNLQTIPEAEVVSTQATKPKSAKTSKSSNRKKRKK